MGAGQWGLQDTVGKRAWWGQANGAYTSQWGERVGGSRPMGSTGASGMKGWAGAGQWGPGASGVKGSVEGGGEGWPMGPTGVSGEK